jgi:PIN domain nuclease of toxin-antitoxin system
MKLLLDTHALIWMTSEPHKLSAAASIAITDARNEIWLSIASIWEVQIKVQIGKLTCNPPLAEMIKAQCTANRLQILSVSLEHIYAIDALAFVHRDPFDRMLIAQANCEGMMLVTSDRIFAGYPVATLW